MSSFPGGIRVALPFASALVAVLAACTGLAACTAGEPAAPTVPAEVDAKGNETIPTFAGTIEAILQERCQRCHSASGIAPFPLVTYEQIHDIAALAREKVVAREMPPWGAFDDDTCKMQHKWKDDLRLTDDELAKLVGWIDGGMPRGKEANRPPPKTYPRVGLDGLTNTLTMAAPYQVGSTGSQDEIRCFTIDPGFTQDAWIGGSNVVPGAPAVVHHAIVYVDPKGESTALADASGSYPCFGGPKVANPSLLLAWAPGVPPTNYGDETGLKIPKGAKLVLQVHYHPNNTSVADQTKFELKTLAGKPTFVAQVLLLGNARSATGTIQLLPGPDDPPSGPAFVIPANVDGHTESMELTLPDKVSGFPLPEIHIASAGAHMHWAGVDMKVEIERKNPVPGQPAKECLLGTPKYDFNWQRGYDYDEVAERLPAAGAGDKLRFTCKYNNTVSNKNIRKALAEQHIAEPREIDLGEETLDEMCLGVLVAVRRATLVD